MPTGLRVVVGGQGAMARALLAAVQASRHHLVGAAFDARPKHTWWVQQLRRLEPWRREVARLALPEVGLGRGAAPQALAALTPDVVLVGDLGVLLRPGLLAVPRFGVVNAHWSLLPEHRGPCPAAAAILAGDPEAGITLHQVDNGVDTGPVFSQQAFALPPRATATWLYHEACRQVGSLVAPLLDRLETEGAGWAQVQDPTLGSRHGRWPERHWQVDWSTSAEHIDRLVRAATAIPAYTTFGNTPIALLEVTPLRRGVPAHPGQVLGRDPLVIAAGEGAIRVERAVRRGFRPLPWRSPTLGATVGHVAAMG